MAVITRYDGRTEWAADGGCTLWTLDRRLAYDFEADAALEVVDTLAASEAGKTFVFGVSFDPLARGDRGAMIGGVSPAAQPNPARRGYRTVTPRLVVADVEAQVRFLWAVFDAAGEVRPGQPAEVRIGDSLVLVSGAEAGRDLLPGSSSTSTSPTRTPRSAERWPPAPV